MSKKEVNLKIEWNKLIPILIGLFLGFTGVLCFVFINGVIK